MDARSVFDDRSLFVRLKPDGFEFRGESRETLEVSYLEQREPVRKLFRDGRLICYAPDGRLSRSGRECTSCPDRGSCQPRLRVRGVTSEGCAFILELPPRASMRFLDFADAVEAGGRLLSEVGLVFTARRTTGFIEVEFTVCETGASTKPAVPF